MHSLCRFYCLSEFPLAERVREWLRKIKIFMKWLVEPCCSKSNTAALGNLTQIGSRKNRASRLQKWLFLRICVFVSLGSNFPLFIKAKAIERYGRCVDSIVWANFPKEERFGHDTKMTQISGKVASATSKSNFGGPAGGSALERASPPIHVNYVHLRGGNRC